MSVHGLEAVQIGAVKLGALTQAAIETGTEVDNQATSGQVYARHTAVTAQNPTASFTSMAIQDLLDAVPLTGVDASSSSIVMWGKKRGITSTGRASGAAHRKYAIDKGILTLGRLSVEHQGDATIQCNLGIAHDGSANDPIIITENQSLPTPIVDNERFTIAAVTLEDVVISQIRSIELDLGITQALLSFGSDLWPTEVSIREILPVLTIRGMDIEMLKAANIPFRGKAITHANTAIYLRKRLRGGTGFVPDATTEHIKLTVSGIAHIDTAMDVSGNDEAEAGLVVTLDYDGTNAPVTINTVSALP